MRVCVCRCRYNANVSLQQFVSLLGVDRGRGKKGRGRGQLNHIVNMEIEARELNGAHNAALLSGFMRACTHFARARTRRDLLCVRCYCGACVYLKIFKRFFRALFFEIIIICGERYLCSYTKSALYILI